MSTIFLTGGTGYLGGYVLTELLARSPHRVAVLTRAADAAEAREKLWRSLQQHMDFEGFETAMARVDIVRGDLHSPRLGIDEAQYEELIGEVESVLHVAASLNRKSSKSCFNSNLRGTLSVIQLARAVADQRPLRRFSYVSTVAVAGQRECEVVTEDAAIEWDRSDYDPYGRTKKFCEHMVAELLPEVDRVVFRPSIVMGDSRTGKTSQFDMVGALVALADLPVVPLRPDTRLDIIPADYVGEAIARIHLSGEAVDPIYHLSAGEQAVTAQEIIDTLATAVGRKPWLFPQMGGLFRRGFKTLDALPRSKAQQVGAMMKVFWPYITYDTVFDNQRVTRAMGRPPARFTDYGADLYRFAKSVGLRYPYEPLPGVEE